MGGLGGLGELGAKLCGVMIWTNGVVAVCSI